VKIKSSGSKSDKRKDELKFSDGTQKQHDARRNGPGGIINPLPGLLCGGSRQRRPWFACDTHAKGV
jgi:hypothetical protein